MALNWEKPLLLGHRGAPYLAPENTLLSFRLALEAGLDGVELDVVLTRDGVFAVRHDILTPLGPAWTLSFSQLKTLDPDTPTLEEVLGLLESYPGKLLNVELKSFPELSERAAPLLAQMLRGREGVWVSSFDPVALRILKEESPDLPIAFLYFGRDLSAFSPCLNLAALHPEKGLVSRDTLSRWHGMGLKVVVWTVNDQRQAVDLLRLGVDGLIGDRPDVLVAAREALSWNSS
ncbi:glycerophosphodiester phosphodiesterase [Thermus antranikianii]|nr:MAG: glycerophosphodiester phosphodiesterase [Thermus antranikianii]